jgi:hypothetical protein
VKLKAHHPRSKPTRNGADGSLWFAIGPILAALLAVSIALYRTPARPVSSEPPSSVEASGPGLAVDPVVHNIGKYIASHQILWPELSRPESTQPPTATADKSLHRHR